VVRNEKIKQELEEHVVNLLKTIPGNKLLLDHYLDGAIEAEEMQFEENVYIIGIMEHIEPCGVHSEIVMRHCLLLI
jgi:carbamoyl-phosphate synthase large subunit